MVAVVIPQKDDTRGSGQYVTMTFMRFVIRIFIRLVTLSEAEASPLTKPMTPILATKHWYEPPGRSKPMQYFQKSGLRTIGSPGDVASGNSGSRC